MNSSSKSLIVAAAVTASLSLSVAAQAANYGCFKVTADELNIRARPYSDAAVIGTASKGEILVKRKMFCTFRGFWCAVSKGSVEGYADKAHMQKMVCP
ncbi:MAG: hypothetical protein WC807_20795 [Hyphomicrobium sp.]